MVWLLRRYEIKLYTTNIGSLFFICLFLKLYLFIYANLSNISSKNGKNIFIYLFIYLSQQTENY